MYSVLIPAPDAGAAVEQIVAAGLGRWPAEDRAADIDGISVPSMADPGDRSTTERPFTVVGRLP